MFNRTGRRLALLNAAVLLLVLSVLGASLYVHMRGRLLHETDEALKQARNRIQSDPNLSELLRSDLPVEDRDDRIMYLFWDPGGELAGQSPAGSLDPATAAKLREHAANAVTNTANAGSKRYRVLTLPNPSGPDGATIEIVRSLKDTDITLQALLLDIGIGIVAGAVISVFAGLFLARRAMIPIRRSWEKQQQFVADASHELRTPTAIIHARSELLFSFPEHTIREESPNIADILKESKRMGKLIEDLLTLARSDSNQLQIQSSPVALSSLLNEIVEQFRFLADTKEIEILSNVHSPLSMRGDEGRIRQLLIILLDNAMKYTPAGGRIEVTGRLQGHSVLVGLSDTGCGISEEDLPYIFERFYRGDKARSRAQGGTGLGLSIARWIVDAHRGTIRVTSKAGEGTKVELTFPRR